MTAVAAHNDARLQAGGRTGEGQVVVARSFPPGRIRSRCGHVRDSLGQSERTYVCGNCGHVMDRDWNAALNIRREGLRLLDLPGGRNRRDTRG
ncbi:MAG: transposase [Deltaproteobacteria bacterium]|nr:transposase [Deltaproteobacteria bacterium]